MQLCLAKGKSLTAYKERLTALKKEIDYKNPVELAAAKKRL